MSAGCLNLKIEQGTDFYRLLKIKTSIGEPLDLTGCELRGQIRKHPSDKKILAAFSFFILNQTTNMGEVEMTLSAESTSAIPAVRHNSAKKISRELSYDIELVDAVGEVERLIEGIVYLSPEVTK